MALHVPERARITRNHPLATDASAGNNGAFVLDSPDHGWQLVLIISDGSVLVRGWEHVSVHAVRGQGGKREQLRTPSWREMSFVKDLCWDDEDVVMQLHPRRSEYVNMHPHTLHLWRHANIPIPTPPKIAV